jgi:hypothetical protein
MNDSFWLTHLHLKTLAAEPVTFGFPSRNGMKSSFKNANAGERASRSGPLSRTLSPGPKSVECAVGNNKEGAGNIGGR